MRWLAGIAESIDVLNDRLGRAISWLVLLLVVVTASVAVLRYVFAVGWVWMQDSYLWISGSMIMLAAGYTLLHDNHVRVDFLYVKRSEKFRALVNLLGAAFLLLPTVLFIAIVSFPFVYRSWERLEGSLEAGGLPGVFLLKSVLVLFCIPLAAQALSMMARSVLVLAGYASGSSSGTGSGDRPLHD
ncbi:MAG: TRAP transporter small permease subunit [Rhodovibrionaceae bacterium]